jgi:hypothetical protein
MTALTTGGTLMPGAAESGPTAVVPFGRVPLTKMVSVPLTLATRTKLWLNELGFPSPMMLSMYVLSKFSSQPQTLYS